ncbi:fucose-specific lectin [Aspergillus sclerotialis]|uniref:Fucose-specific lectin n=1 Tax=Aspergillus sclerotialis TaxID=2070753 RepID=A0A3A3A129_9EURO|nr:fucose-specific lectin [Aspergillus sclerotialis]
MAAIGAQEVDFRSAIAAVNATSHLRVYTQDVFGKIRESLYEGSWTNGTSKNVIATGKLCTPMAATSKQLQNIRVHYLSEQNTLKEAAYDSGKGWYDGGMSSQHFAVAPYSKVAACMLAGFDKLVLRVYAQIEDNTIQEYGWDSDSSGWRKMTNLGAAMPGTHIGCTSYKTSQLSIRLYIQNEEGDLVEKCYDANRGWYNGGLKVPEAPPRAAIAATSFNATSSSVSIRVYYAGPDDRLLEKAWDGQRWQDGGFNERSIPGTQVAVVNWGSGPQLNLRVYFQKGEFVSGVSEWAYSSGRWGAGRNAIPPA